MIKCILITSLFFLVSISLDAQEIRPNYSPKSSKEDVKNFYNSEGISNIDLLQALDVVGIRIFKFNLHKFDTINKVIVTIEEYQKQHLIDTDTIYAGNNLYRYYYNGTSYFDYIDQIKFFTVSDSINTSITFGTYQLMIGPVILPHLLATPKHHYNLRTYYDTDWMLNKKIPLIAIASSWEDVNNGVQRFCGPSILKIGDELTEDLFAISPHYYIINLTVSN